MRQYASSQIKSLVLPFTVLIIVPVLLLWCSKGFRLGWGLGLTYDTIAICVGLAVTGAGLYLLITTILLFRNIGKGTLAPWAPPEKLVVFGPYRYVRNPMITGVLIVLGGEAIVFGSTAIFVMFVLFFIINHIYFIRSEEPGLVRRFGDQYIRYMKNVPRWIPRLNPWENNNSHQK
jgi:protein-S-isoprenylcysteine O-methyltransferase Ste14